jgi:hypothetical protein
MTRLKDCPQIEGNIPSDMVFVKTPNGKTFLRKGLETSDAFIDLAVKKKVKIIGDYCPKVHKEVSPKTQGAKVTADNKEAFIEVRIDELTEKDSYWTDISSKNFEISEEFMTAMTIAQLKAWATERGITLKATKKSDIISEILTKIV